MGESTCLMHSVSFASGMPNESNIHGNHVHDLGDSVSFGRFTSESLAWEKWSAFSHKRYVEEAKSYAQPGSVAQKKAFFEAHYKKVAAQKAAAAAAAAAEQEKIKSQIEERICDTNHGAHDLVATVLSKSHDIQTQASYLHDSQTIVLQTNKLQPVSLNLKMAVNEEQQIITQDASKEMVASDHSSIVNLVEQQIEKNKGLSNNTQDFEERVSASVSVSEDSRTSQIILKILKNKGLSNNTLFQLTHVCSHHALKLYERISKRNCLILLQSKSNTDQEVLQPKIKRKPAVPSFRSTSVGKKQSRIPYSPAKYVHPMHSRKENMVTPTTKNSNTMESVDKKRSAPRSLYSLMKSGSVKEPCKLNSPAVRKIETTKLAPSAHATPKRSATPMITPSKVANGASKQPLATPPVKQRMETPVHPSAAAGTKTPGQKWHIFSAVSKSLSAYRNKLQSPTVSSPFTLRTEERAARRKQKLEEKFNEKEAQKVQLQTTLKEKAETEFRRLRQSFCFKARPLPSFYNETPKSPVKKTPQANLRSLTPARKPPTTISQPSSTKKSSRRLWKTYDQNPNTHPLASLARRINHENVSPNIQN